MADARDRLAAERTSAAATLAAVRAELDDVLESASSTTGDDEHDPEGATIGFERAQARGAVNAAIARVAAIDAALFRVDAGTYGRCVRCGQPIGAVRLAARPAADRCVSCAT